MREQTDEHLAVSHGRARTEWTPKLSKSCSYEREGWLTRVRSRAFGARSRICRARRDANRCSVGRLALDDEADRLRSFIELEEVEVRGQDAC